MFCDLVGSTALSLSLDPEDLRDILRAYHAACEESIQRYGGHIAQYLGDGILVYFGYPTAFEDGAERAVRAGLNILHQIDALSRRFRRQYSIDFAVRIGIRTGRVVVGQVGSGPQQEQLAIGDTPNIAARLQSIAPINSLVVGETTYRLIRHAFECVEMEEQTLKGLGNAERAFRVVGERLLDGSPLDLILGSPTETIGRARELEEFASCWEEVRAGSGRALVLTGQPGIGKSHAVHTFRRYLSSRLHARHEMRCSPFHTCCAYYPFIEWLQRALNFYPDQPAADRLEMLRFVLERSRLNVAEALPLLGSLLSVPLESMSDSNKRAPSFQRERLQEILIELLTGMADGRPMLIIIEDLHWVDPSSQELLERFAERLATLPVLLLLTSRPPFDVSRLPAATVREVRMDRLSPAEVEEMIRSVARGVNLPDAVVGQIARKSDGVPLFIQELTRRVVELGTWRHGDGEAQLSKLAIPTTLQDSLMARLDRLLPVKEVAQLCATLGREFSYSMIEAVANLPAKDLQAALTRLVEAEILFVEGAPPHSRYMFRHVLVQDAAYESLLRSRRREFHRRIAEFLIAEPAGNHESEVIAHHFARAGRKDEAAENWYRAGQVAQTRSANTEAIMHYERVLQTLAELPVSPSRRRLRVVAQAGLAVALLQKKGYGHPDVHRALETARKEAQESEDREVEFSILRGLTAHYVAMGRHEDARVISERMNLLAGHLGDVSSRLEAARALQATAFWRGEAAAVRAEADATLNGLDPSVYKASPLRYDHPVVSMLSYLSLALWYLGEPEEAAARGEEAVSLARRLDLPFSLVSALGYSACLNAYIEDRAMTRSCATETIELASEYGFPFWKTLGVVLQAWSYADEDPDKYLEGLKDGLAVLRREGIHVWTSHPSALLAEEYCRRGLIEEGLATINEALDQAERTGELYFAPELHRIHGDLLRRRGSGEALEAYDRGFDLAVKQQALPLAGRIGLRILEGAAPAGRRKKVEQVVYGDFLRIAPGALRNQFR